MPGPELFLLFVRPLNEAGIRYMVAGSVAVIFYGEPRLTHDVDFVCFLNSNDIARLNQIFPSSDFYVRLPTSSFLKPVARNAVHSPSSMRRRALKRMFI